MPRSIFWVVRNIQFDLLSQMVMKIVLSLTGGGVGGTTTVSIPGLYIFLYFADWNFFIAWKFMQFKLRLFSWFLGAFSSRLCVVYADLLKGYFLLWDPKVRELYESDSKYRAVQCVYNQLLGVFCQGFSF